MDRQRLVQLLAFVLKEVRQTTRDRRVMSMLLVAPVIQLIVFGYAVNLDVDRVPTVVVDLDRTTRSRHYLSDLMAEGTLEHVAEVMDPEQAQAMLEGGQAAVAVIIPRGLDRRLTRREPAEVQVLLDGTDPNRSGVAAGFVTSYFGWLGSRLSEPPQPALRVQPQIYYNPSLKTAIFMVPGITAMLLLLVTTIVTAMGVAREREMGTLEQVLVTPVPSWVVMLGKLLPFLAVGLFDFALALTVGSWVFDMPVRGNILLLLLATGLYLASTLGLGLLISTFSSSQQQAFMGGFLFMIPAMLLSGILTPISSMPEWMQPITYLNPVRYYIESLRAVLLKGAGLRDIWPQFTALAVFGALVVTLATRRFHSRMG